MNCNLIKALNIYYSIIKHSRQTSLLKICLVKKESLSESKVASATQKNPHPNTQNIHKKRTRTQRVDRVDFFFCFGYFLTAPYPCSHGILVEWRCVFLLLSLLLLFRTNKKRNNWKRNVNTKRITYVKSFISLSIRTIRFLFWFCLFSIANKNKAIIARDVKSLRAFSTNFPMYSCIHMHGIEPEARKALTTKF